MCWGLYTWVQWLRRAEEDARYAEAGVTGGFDSPSVSAEDWTQVLCKAVPALDHGGISADGKSFLTIALSSGINWLVHFVFTTTLSAYNPSALPHELTCWLWYRKLWKSIEAERIRNHKRLCLNNNNNNKNPSILFLNIAVRHTHLDSNFSSFGFESKKYNLLDHILK